MKIKLLSFLFLISFQKFSYSLTSPKDQSLGDSPCGSHIFALSAAVANTTGPILELGAGNWSTPLLHSLCKPTSRFLLTIETNKKWMNTFDYLTTIWHQFMYLSVFEDDYSLNAKPYLWDTVGNDKHWGLVFIDHYPNYRRSIDMQRLRSKADVIVAHDTEPEWDAYYGYDKVISTFKWR